MLYRLLTRNLNISGFIKRNIYQSPLRKCSDGRTVATVLNSEAEVGLMIDAYSEVGFRLNNDFTVLGPMLIFPRSVLSWQVNDVSEITEESLSLFTVLEPKIDILVIGVGDEKDKIPNTLNILKFMRKHKLNVEILPTAKACPTFNFLNYEGRYVAGALIPPSNVNATENDVLQTKLRYQRIYEQEDPLF